MLISDQTKSKQGCCGSICCRNTALALSCRTSQLHLNWKNNSEFSFGTVCSIVKANKILPFSFFPFFSDMAQETNQSPVPMLCATGCGFYGNPRTNGMCSVCYKEHLTRQQSSDRMSPLSPMGECELMSTTRNKLELFFCKSILFRSILHQTCPDVCFST